MYNEGVLKSMKPLKILILMNNQKLLTQIEEVSGELGDPDCKLIEPFVLGRWYFISMVG